MRRRRSIVAVLALLLFPGLAAAQEVREYTENGIRYRETRSKVLRPKTETVFQEREQTVYREQVSTETREIERTVHVPVTEYAWEPHLVGRWNPLIRPYYAYRLVPRTRLEARTEIVKRPVTQRSYIPEKRTVKVPVTTRRMVEEEVIRRVAISPSGSRDPFASGTSVANQSTIGGAKLENDPPRQAWRPSTRR